MTGGASLLDEAHRRPAPSPLISGPSPSSLLSPRSPLPAASMDRSYSNSSEASTSTANAQPVTLHLVSTFSYVASLGISAPPHIKAKTSHKVVKIKRAVYKHWPGRPRIEGIRLIYAGRVLQDEETLAMVLQPGQTEAYIHLAVRPDAWSERDKAPLTPTGPRMLAAMPPNMTKPAASPARLRSTTVDPLEGSSYFSLPSELPSTSTSAASTPGLRLADLVHMEALPRVLSISYKLYHERYSRLYESAIPVDQSFMYGAASKQAIDEVERQVFKWRSWSDVSSTMTLPQQLRTCYDRMERIRLTLELLEDFKTQPSLAQGLSATSPDAGPAPLPTATVANSPQQPIAIPRPTVAELVGMVMPVVFLALKLGLLLYIFTMHASKTKRLVMIAAATVWVAMEMVRTWRRRIRRLASAQRRAARAQRRASGQQDRPAPTTRQSTSPATPAASPALRIPVAPQRYSATSPSELRFWLQRLAFVGLDEEDLELGLRPGASQAQAWMIRVTRERLALRNGRDRRPRVAMLQNFDMTRAIYELFYPVVLYAITLIPDCEDLRRREVNKRSDLIRKWWSQTGRAWVETKRRELESDERDEGEDVGGSRRPVELPRLLKHPHVLRLLDLKRTADGLVVAANLAESSNERRIDIREELDAAREQARPDGAGGAGVAAAADEGIGELDEEDGNDEIGWAIF